MSAPEITDAELDAMEARAMCAARLLCGARGSDMEPFRAESEEAIRTLVQEDIPALTAEVGRLRAAAERWKHVTEQAYLATSDDGALLLTVYLADDINVPFLTRRERAQLAGDAEPFGVVRGAEAITR